MIKRLLETKIPELLRQFPAVAILGQRQVGKTTLAKNLIKQMDKESLYLDLELPADINRLSNPQMLFEENKGRCVVIDEIQRMPELFPILRAVIDRDRVPGRFIILGSASPGVLRNSSETLAGRISYTELSPFLLSEVKALSPGKKLWIRGGFPEPFLMEKEVPRFLWFSSFTRTYIERELPMLGLRAHPVQLNRLLSMLAFNQGQVLNVSKFSKALGVSSPTVSRYLDYLEQSYFIRRLPPYFINIRKRVVKSPKIYIRDSGILHHILGLENFNDVMGHPVAGESWEGFVIQQIISYYGNRFDYTFYRTQDGTECDLVISKGITVLACIEVKLSDAPHITKGFTISLRDLKPHHAFIIIPDCPEPYKLNENTLVCDLSGFFHTFGKLIT
jgi:predicted AAA+ superfamily ATPase